MMNCSLVSSPLPTTHTHLSDYMQKVAVALIAAIVVSSASLHAQQADTVVLEGVVISATKTPTASSALTQSVTVITSEELRARGIGTVAEALRGLPGVAIASNGSYGSLTSLFLRGGESRYTKFLIDGVPVNAVGGYFDLSHLTTDNIERIEVVRGPASAVHGADAVSGLVQIFTRKGSGPARATADVRAGTYSTVHAALGLAGATDRGGYTLQGARQSTEGILPFNNDYVNETVSGSVRFAPQPATRISLTTRGTHAVSHFPTDFAGNVVDSNAYRDQRRLTLSLDAARTIKPGVELGLIGGANTVTDFTDNITTAGTTRTQSRFTSHNRRRRAEGRLGFTSGLGQLTVGAEYQTEWERSGSASGPVSGALTESSKLAGRRTTRAAYAEQLARLGRAALTLGGRIDDPSDFDRATTFRLGTAVSLLPGSSVRGSLSTAYNAPAFFQLLDTKFTVGNPALTPESSRNVEVGASQTLPRGLATLSATYFDQSFDELIEFVPGGPPSFMGTYGNLRGATSRGLELELRAAPHRGWSGSASATWLRAVVSELASGYKGSAKVGDELLRRPRKSGHLSLWFTAGDGASAVLSARHVGKRPDLDFRTFPSNRVILPGVTVADLAGSFPLFRNGRAPMALTLRVDNIFDKEYQEVFNFDAPGRRFLVGGRVGAVLR